MLVLLTDWLYLTRQTFNSLGRSTNKMTDIGAMDKYTKCSENLYTVWKSQFGVEWRLWSCWTSLLSRRKLHTDCKFSGILSNAGNVRSGSWRHRWSALLLGRRCHIKESKWINGFLERHVSWMYFSRFRLYRLASQFSWRPCVRVLSMGTLESQSVRDQILHLRKTESAHQSRKWDNWETSYLNSDIAYNSAFLTKHRA